MRETDLRDLLMGTADAAFATGLDGVIRIWNQGAEQLVGIPARDAVDRSCAELLEGLDSQDAALCSADCPVLQMAARGIPVPCFDLRVKVRGVERQKWVNVSILLAHTSDGELLAVHLLRDIESRKELETVTERFLNQVGSLTGRDIAQLLSPPHPPHIGLTDRERKIVRLLARGLSTLAISQELKISHATARNHVQHILKKLSSHSRAVAVLRAVRERLV